MNNISKIYSFFITFSGAKKDILRECKEKEHMKYAVFGALVLMTTSFAFISGTFAAYEFAPGYPYLAFLGGIMWALFILLIDIGILMTIKRSDRNNWVFVVIRILVGVFAAYVVSKPLEVALFQSQINFKMEEYGRNKLVKNEQENKRIVDSYANKVKDIDSVIVKQQKAQKDILQIPSLTKEYTSCNGEAQSIYATYQTCAGVVASLQGKYQGKMLKDFKLYDANIFQANQACANSKLYEYTQKNNICNVLKNKLDVAQKQYDDWEKNFVPTKRKEQTIIDLNKTQKDSTLTNVQRNLEKLDKLNRNLPRKVGVLSQITSFYPNDPDNEGNFQIWLGIFLVLVIVEIAPVSVKMMAPQSDYDYRERAQDDAERTLTGKPLLDTTITSSIYYISYLNDLNSTNSDNELRETRNRLQKKLDSFYEFIEYIFSHQNRFAKYVEKEEYKITRIRTRERLNIEKEAKKRHFSLFNWFKWKKKNKTNKKEEEKQAPESESGNIESRNEKNGAESMNNQTNREKLADAMQSNLDKFVTNFFNDIDEAMKAYEIKREYSYKNSNLGNEQETKNSEKNKTNP
ncbi:MAG: DUF4407 domain-containing protein [Bacteroidetes bacterium]|nr:MAG: DUF4407 domain-containing protein [Bacteroidota bacterium]TAG90328.1 MAG: DUF4407 domain-containing protein [Bacteroidota bacterium]